MQRISLTPYQLVEHLLEYPREICAHEIVSVDAWMDEESLIN
jgi:hypothetical protein